MASISTNFQIEMDNEEQVNRVLETLKIAIEKLNDNEVVKNQLAEFLKECKGNQQHGLIRTGECFNLSYAAFYSLFPDIYKTIARIMPNSSFISETYLTSYNSEYVCSCKANLKDGKLTVNMTSREAGVEDLIYKNTVKVESLADFELDLGEEWTNHPDLICEDKKQDFIVKNGVLKKYTGIKKDVVIPDNVLVIGSKAFEESSIESVKISNSVTEIKKYAFKNCKKLVKVEIGENVISIGKNVFFGCSSLANITVKKKNKSFYCAGECLIEKSSKTLICGYKNSIIPLDGSIVRIAESAFMLRQPRAIVIPKSVIEIGTQAFTCAGLKKISVEDGNTKFYAEGNCLIETETKSVVVGCADAIIPSDGSVLSIGDYAFSGGSMRSVNIPSCVLSIGNSAFENCKKLEEVVIENGVKYIGNNAFYGCNALTEIHIPDSVLTIDYGAFKNCSGTIQLKLGEGVTAIGNEAFKGCKKIADVTFGTKLEQIGDEAFSNCVGLIKIILPETVEKIGRAVFKNCKSLSVAELGNNIAIIESEAFSSCEMLSVIKLQSGITKISYHAFYGCNALEEIDIPETVNDIGAGAFEFCSQLRNIDIPECIKDIANETFENCRELKSVAIPCGVKNIGDSAFGFCESLSYVDLPDGIISIGRNAFYGCYGLTGIGISSSVKEIAKGVFGACKKLTNIEIMEGNTEFKIIDGILYSSDGKRLLKCPVNKTVADIPNGVEVIDDFAFEDCTQIYSITIPKSVLTIGICAFENCTLLKRIVVPASVLNMGAFAFRGNVGLLSFGQEYIKIFCEAPSKPQGWDDEWAQKEGWSHEPLSVTWGYKGN